MEPESTPIFCVGDAVVHVRQPDWPGEVSEVRAVAEGVRHVLGDWEYCVNWTAMGWHNEGVRMGTYPEHVLRGTGGKEGETDIEGMEARAKRLADPRTGYTARDLPLAALTDKTILTITDVPRAAAELRTLREHALTPELLSLIAAHGTLVEAMSGLYRTQERFYYRGETERALEVTFPELGAMRDRLFAASQEVSALTEEVYRIIKARAGLP